MKLRDKNPRFQELFESSATEVLFNTDTYKILTFFELKQNPEDTVPLSWANITELSYTDDIALIGLTGKMVLNNPAGIYDKILNMIKDVYLGVYLYNEKINYEENIYFSIIDSYALPETRTSEGCSYLLSLQEAFISEGSARNFMMMHQEAVSSNIYDLFEYIIKLITSDLTISARTGDIVDANSFELSESTYSKRVIDIDTDSLAEFRNKYPDEKIGGLIYDNITSSDSCSDVLQDINKYLVLQSSNIDSSIIDTSLQGDLVSCRSENMTAKNSGQFGERKITLRNYRDTFTNCFQNKYVYEILTSALSYLKYKTDKNYSFLSALVPNGKMIKKYPVNLSLFTKEWCDYISIPDNEPDSFTGILYRFEDIINCFNKNYLYSVENSNILIPEKISRGITKKIPFFGNSEVFYSTFAKTIKSFFTINEMVEIIMPGNIHRKANEIIFVDDSLRISSKDMIGGQIALDNSFTANYYFVTRVAHNFKGQQYSNQVFMCSFSKK